MNLQMENLDAIGYPFDLLKLKDDFEIENDISLGASELVQTKARVLLSFDNSILPKVWNEFDVSIQISDMKI